MSREFGQYVRPVRLAWDNQPYIKYYGKKNRGKKRLYLNQEYEPEIKSFQNNGYYFTEDRPLAKIASTMIIKDQKQQNDYNSFNSFGIQAKESKETEDTNDSDNGESSPDTLQRSKKLKRIVLRRISPSINSKPIDSYATFDNRITAR